MQRLKPYIYQKEAWPNFIWSYEAIVPILGETRFLQGQLIGKMEQLGFELKNEAVLDTLTMDVIKSSEIEGEHLNPSQVRSSVARKLGLDFAGSIESDRNVDGMVEMMVDATNNCHEFMSSDRLFNWHGALFPSGRSGLFKIDVGTWRTDHSGPMQVVSGALGKEKVHFEAPPSNNVPFEMKRFLTWYNKNDDLDLVLKAAIAHLWFVTIHPFEDGNGRMARAIADSILAKSDKSSQRYYSMSAQIKVERKQYYLMLEKTQQGSLDITRWIIWFLNCLSNAVCASEEMLNQVMVKADFWSFHAKTIINKRQRLILNKLLDEFEGKLTSSKWAKMAKCSKDTAIRDINDLMEKGMLKKESAGGRSTSYELAR